MCEIVYKNIYTFLNIIYGRYKRKRKITKGISFRLDFIKDLLDGKKLEPMFDLETQDTEQFIHPNGYNRNEDDSKSLSKDVGNLSKGGNSEKDDDVSTKDIRKILNKKIHDFNKIINEIGGKLLYIKSGTTGHTFKGI